MVKDYDVGFDSLAAILGYLYTGRVRPAPRDVCVCVDEDCRHVACRPAVNFMVEVLIGSFTFQITELVALFQVINRNTESNSSLLALIIIDLFIRETD